MTNNDPLKDLLDSTNNFTPAEMKNLIKGARVAGSLQGAVLTTFSVNDRLSLVDSLELDLDINNLRMQPHLMQTALILQETYDQGKEKELTAILEKMGKGISR